MERTCIIGLECGKKQLYSINMRGIYMADRLMEIDNKLDGISERLKEINTERTELIRRRLSLVNEYDEQLKLEKEEAGFAFELGLYNFGRFGREVGDNEDHITKIMKVADLEKQLQEIQDKRKKLRNKYYQERAEFYISGEIKNPTEQQE